MYNFDVQEIAGLMQLLVESYFSGSNKPEMRFCTSLLGFLPELQSIS